MIPLKVVNHLDVDVDVGVSDEGLCFKIDGLHYTDAEPDVHTLNKAVSFTNPFVFNRAHTNHVLSNIEYLQGNGLVKAVLAGEYTVQQVPFSQASDIHQLTEQTIISMEEYRQYRCHKTLLTFCETQLGGNLEAAYYMANYNVTVKVLTPKGTMVAVGCGFTLDKRDGTWHLEESMITMGDDPIVAGFVFLPLHVFTALEQQLGTYLVKGCQ